jgi:hypothetical protein
MTQKYELVKTNRKDGLFQIKALRDGPWGPVGTLGGFVESAKNLSHSDDCWLYDKAEVFNNAEVSDDVEVREKKKD